MKKVSMFLVSMALIGSFSSCSHFKKCCNKDGAKCESSKECNKNKEEKKCEKCGQPADKCTKATCDQKKA
jgi:hypothetical protein